jgi:glutamyl-tRNA synthetase
VARLLIPFLEQAGLKKEVSAVSPEWLAQLVVMVRERTKTLVEMVAWVTPYFGPDAALDEAAAKKFLTPAMAPALSRLVERFEAEPTFHKEQWETIFKKVVEEQGMKMGQLAQPVRVALTGRTASPGLFDVMEVLGRERTLARLKKGVARAAASA